MTERYKIIAPVAALYKDEKMTQKKGKVPKDIIFALEKKNTEGTMLKTSSVQYLDQDTGIPTSGDGWIEAIKCALLVTGPIVPQPPQPPVPPPTFQGTVPSIADFLAFARVMAWLKTIISAGGG